jgi:hypothetical protein
VIPIAPPRRPPPGPESEPPPTDERPDPEHDPHHAPQTGLPVSVLVGMALVPFGIPLLWLVAPFVTGQEAALSMAVPVSLAVAAAALCLGVVYTIDWTGTTRVKGVLMLVGLAYLSAAGLYFLKKDLVDRIQRFGGDPNRWHEVGLDKGNCRVRLPGHVDTEPPPQPPLDGLVRLNEWRTAHATDPQDGSRYEYRIAVSRADAAAVKPDDAWYARVGEKLQDGGAVEGPPAAVALWDAQNAGRQWTLKLAAPNAFRVVRVYVVKGRVYYLSAEGPGLRADDDFGKLFFGSFRVN